MNKLIRAALLAAIVAAVPATALAQRPFPGQMPRTWATAYALMYTGLSGLNDPGTASRWVFDDNAYGFGAALQRQVGQSLRLGIDGSFARPRYERRDLTSQAIIASGNASIVTAMASGRYGYAGGSDVGLYLAGGIGTVAYRLQDLDAWNADFALQAGTGLEYRFGGNKAGALEWGRTWGYHEKEELGGGSQRHSRLSLALRIGF